MKAIFNKVEWDSDIEIALSSALGDDLHLIKNEVKNGISEVWQLSGLVLGFLVTRVEIGKKRTMVLVAMFGSGGYQVLDVFYDVARKMNCQIMRIHSGRAGAYRYLLIPGISFLSNQTNQNI